MSKSLYVPVNLSPRESQVVRLATQGKSDKEIAEELNIARRTVGVHIQAARLKGSAILARRSNALRWILDDALWDPSGCV